jgi:hypothetical protein
MEIDDYEPDYSELEEYFYPDSAEESAKAEIISFFNGHPEGVFYSRQLEIRFERKYFHWITNRAIRALVGLGKIKSETRKIASGGEIHLLWNRGFRYYRRAAKAILNLVEQYAAPNITASIGLHGEFMVLEGFARFEFVMRGRNTNNYKERQWPETSHNLDFIFEKEGTAYGIEVKNALGYMDHKEMKKKIEICRFLDIKPVFVTRMMPKTWIHELIEENGYAMILGYQLYPWTHKELAAKVHERLGLPVDAPKALADGTMKRFEKWRKKT